MTNLVLPRRKFFTGLGALFAAPAIVRASSLMPIHAVPEAAIEVFLISQKSLYEELTAITRRAFVPRLFVDIYDTDPIQEMFGK